MTDTMTTTDEIVGRVTYRTDERGAERREWLYVVTVLADMLFGVAFTNDKSNPRPAWVTVPRSSTRADNDATGYGEIRHLLTVVDWWPEMLADFFRASANQDQDAPRVSGDQDTDQAYQRGVADGRAQEERTHQAWISSLVTDAHQWADDNSLCSEFDRFMSEHGLPSRRQDFTVTLSLSYTTTVSVEARDEDDAAEQAEERFREYPRDYIDLSCIDVEVIDVEEE